MKKKQYSKFDRHEQPKPKKRVKLEVYDDGLYVGTIPTDFFFDENHPIAEETIMEYVYKKFPTRKKKYLTVRIV